MDLNWRAIGVGIVVSIIIGLLSGMNIPFTNASLPYLGAGLTGIIAGIAAGYVDARGLSSGALQGGVATAIGAIVVGIVLTVIGTLAAGVVGLSLAGVFLVLIIVNAIPGIIGGAIGGYFHRSSEAERAKPAA